MQWRDASSKASGSLASRRRAVASRACSWRAGDERRHDRVRDDRQLRRPMGARVRALAPASNVPLYAAEHFYLVTKADRRRDARPARHPRSRRLLYYKEEVGGLVMGGFEPKAKPWNVDPIPDGFEFQLLPEDWDHFEILMTKRDPPHAVPRDRRGQAAAERPGELHARRQFHPRRGAGARAAIFVCAGFNSAGIANAGGAGKLVAEWIVERRSAARPVGRRHSPLRALPRQPPAPRRPHGRVARPALCDALAARGTRDGAPAAPLAALRPARREGRGVRQQDELGARELFSPAGAVGAAVHVRHARLAAARAGGAARVPRGRRRVRPDVVRQIRAQGPRRARGAAAAVRERNRRPRRHDGLHRDAQRARRVRERSHDHSRRAPPSSSSSPARRRRRATAAWIERAHRRRRARGARRRDERVFGASR